MQEVTEAEQLEGSWVGDALLVVLGVEDQRWEYVDAKALYVVHGAVHLGNDYIIEVFDSFPQDFPEEQKAFALFAVGRVVHYKDISGRVIHDIAPGVAHNDFDWFIVVFWDWRRFGSITDKIVDQHVLNDNVVLIFFVVIEKRLFYLLLRLSDVDSFLRHGLFGLFLGCLGLSLHQQLRLHFLSDLRFISDWFAGASIVSG